MSDLSASGRLLGAKLYRATNLSLPNAGAAIFACVPAIVSCKQLLRPILAPGDALSNSLSSPLIAWRVTVNSEIIPVPKSRAGSCHSLVLLAVGLEPNDARNRLACARTCCSPRIDARPRQVFRSSANIPLPQTFRYKSCVTYIGKRMACPLRASYEPCRIY